MSQFRPPSLHQLYTDRESREAIKLLLDSVSKIPECFSATQGVDDPSRSDSINDWTDLRECKSASTSKIFESFSRSDLQALSTNIRFSTISLKREDSIGTIGSELSSLLRSRGQEPPACRMSHEDRVQTRFFG